MAVTTASMNDVMRWVYWWHSLEETPEDIELIRKEPPPLAMAGDRSRP